MLEAQIYFLCACAVARERVGGGRRLRSGCPEQPLPCAAPRTGRFAPHAARQKVRRALQSYSRLYPLRAVWQPGACLGILLRGRRGLRFAMPRATSAMAETRPLKLAPELCRSSENHAKTDAVGCHQGRRGCNRRQLHPRAHRRRRQMRTPDGALAERARARGRGRQRAGWPPVQPENISQVVVAG